MKIIIDDRENLFFLKKSNTMYFKYILMRLGYNYIFVQFVTIFGQKKRGGGGWIPIVVT